MKKEWYRDAYRRAVIDMHIPDWDEQFLSKFDPDRYVDALVASRAQSIVCYAHSHVGLFNYPTKVGQQHKGLKGRNIVQEMIDRCHAKDIAVVLYTSLIHDGWAFDHHPEWGMKRQDGVIYGQGGRYRVVCPNSPYREYVRSWVREICESFDFEGMRFDMTFWVGVCYCDHCRKRFADEVGGEMPVTVDWLDPRWVALQKKREEWLAEFASIPSETVRKLKPGASVEHQSSTYPLNWSFGVGRALVGQNDFLQGDFYGDALQGSFVRKLLEDLTPNRPFAYETSACVELRDHTTLKSEALLGAKAAAAIADGAAFVFIDAIDPIGTVNMRAHERMGRVFDRLKDYYPHLGGERVQDVALYYSLESKFNFRGNGKPAAQADTSDSHTESTMQAARLILGAHLPLGVMTKATLSRLPEIKLLVLSGVNMMDEEECAAIREWVRGGGTLYASGCTSLVDKTGRMREDFMLGDVFGVKLKSKPDWTGREHYIAPTEAGVPHFGEYAPDYPAYVRGYGMDVESLSGAEALATRTLPWTAPDGTKFSSIHSNPPWQATPQPEVVLNRFGFGRAVYCSSLLETGAGLGGSFIALLRHLNPIWRFEVEAPPCVEATLFHQPDRHRYVMTLMNFQKEMPNIPIDDIHVRLRLDGKRVSSIRDVSTRDEFEFRSDAGTVFFSVPRLETISMFSITVR